MIKRFMLMGCCFMILAGCSGTPGESTMADQLEQKMNQQFGVEFVQIDDLEKINGREDGENKYIADVEYDMVFTKDVDDVAKGMMRQNQSGSNSRAADAARSMLAGFGAIALEANFGKFKEGDRKHMKKMLTFVQSENGWVLIN